MANWKDLVKAVAPTIATGLGGPLAGIAVNVLSNVLLGKAEGTEEEIGQYLLSGQPDILLKLKQAEYDFKLKLKEADISLERIAQEDRSSARQREMVVKDKAPGRLAIASFVGFFGILTGLMIMAYQGIDIPTSAKDPLLIMLGVLGALVAGITNYYYGSSAGSADKTQMIKDMLEKK